MEKEMIYNTLDCGPELANIYFSQCISCRHFEEEKDKCPAFPDGIPDDILYEMKKHDSIHHNQVGGVTFEE